MGGIKEIIKILKEEHNIINLFWTNFYAIDEDVYRSAQILPWKLKKLIKKYNIKTIINLRGKKNYLYIKEKEICYELGVKYIEFQISSRILPTVEEMIELKKLFEKNQKPILFHCKAGADRTGFTATFYRVVIKKEHPKVAVKKELTLKHGFISLSKAGRVKEFFLSYDGKEDFFEWARKNRDRIQENFSEKPFIDFIYEKVLRRE